VTYITDVRYQPDYGKCRVEAFGSNPLPAHTLLTISQLAWRFAGPLSGHSFFG
jgi:hypothetical protein